MEYTFTGSDILNSEDVTLGKFKWLTTKEAAEYLRITVGSMKNLVYRGRVTPRKLGRLNRFKRSDLDKLLETSIQGGY